MQHPTHNLGKNSLVARYTAWEDGVLADTDINSDYRLHIRFENCKAEVIEALDNSEIKLDMMDYQIRYVREAVHREECDDKSGYHIQWKRTRKNRDFSNKGKDAFMLNVGGVQTSTAGKPFNVWDIKKCLSKAVINIAKYTEGNKLNDYTKCEAYKYCGKDIDWEEDGTTTTSTTKTTTTTTTTTTTKPEINDMYRNSVTFWNGFRDEENGLYCDYTFTEWNGNPEKNPCGSSNNFYSAASTGWGLMQDAVQAELGLLPREEAFARALEVRLKQIVIFGDENRAEVERG